jgi:hypothetical protein
MQVDMNSTSKALFQDELLPIKPSHLQSMNSSLSFSALLKQGHVLSNGSSSSNNMNSNVNAIAIKDVHAVDIHQSSSKSASQKKLFSSTQPIPSLTAAASASSDSLTYTGSASASNSSVGVGVGTGIGNGNGLVTNTGIGQQFVKEFFRITNKLDWSLPQNQPQHPDAPATAPGQVRTQASIRMQKHSRKDRKILVESHQAVHAQQNQYQQYKGLKAAAAAFSAANASNNYNQKNNALSINKTITAETAASTALSKPFKADSAEGDVDVANNSNSNGNTNNENNHVADSSSVENARQTIDVNHPVLPSASSKTSKIPTTASTTTGSMATANTSTVTSSSMTSKTGLPQRDRDNEAGDRDRDVKQPVTAVPVKTIELQYGHLQPQSHVHSQSLSQLHASLKENDKDKYFYTVQHQYANQSDAEQSSSFSPFNNTLSSFSSTSSLALPSQSHTASAAILQALSLGNLVQNNSSISRSNLSRLFSSSTSSLPLPSPPHPSTMKSHAANGPMRVLQASSVPHPRTAHASLLPSPSLTSSSSFSSPSASSSASSSTSSMKAVMAMMARSTDTGVSRQKPVKFPSLKLTFAPNLARMDDSMAFSTDLPLVQLNSNADSPVNFNFQLPKSSKTRLM